MRAHAHIHVGALAPTASTPSSQSVSSFEVEAVVRGYKEIWIPSIGEELICARERENPRDPLRFATRPCALAHARSPGAQILVELIS